MNRKRSVYRIAVAAGAGLLMAGFVLLSALAQQPAAPKPWMNTSLSPDRRADLVMAEMTLDEKITLVHGMGWFEAVGPRWNGGAGTVSGIPRLGLPDLQMADSAVGVRAAAGKGRYATLLPSTLGEAASWDPKVAFQYGQLIGRELRDQQYNVSLGGGMDITREPRNGRNFEYLGEDPVLAGKMAAQFVQGLQSQKVIGDVKHYAFNDQETGRNIGNVKIDTRSMRETDLLAFEIAVTEGKPGMVMCSYNKLNGDWACENRYLLTDVLKTAWGFQGFVISDWGGTHSTVKAALAGLDNEAPESNFFGNDLKKAVEGGAVPMARLNDMVHRIVRTEFACGVVDDPPRGRVVDPFAGADTSQFVAEQGSVLLKNAENVLPLNASTVKSILLVGSHADKGVLSGGGSAQVDPPGSGLSVYGGPEVWFPSSPLKTIRAKAPKARVEYNDGANPAAAAAAAKGAEVAIVFVNQPTSEDRDLPTLTLPGKQDDLVSAVAAANPRTIVVLETGAPAAMPWIGQVPGAIEIWYPGIRGAEALANILFGDVNPSGKLPVSFAKSDADLPHPKIAGMDLLRPGVTTMPDFDINYTEGLKVGYKWFESEDKQPLFAFGDGLSYTTFAYSGLKASMDSVTFTVRNTGKRAGAETAQVYAGLPAAANEPPKRLVAWEKIQLAPGESKAVTLHLEPKLLSIFDVSKNDWQLLGGEYRFFVGGSSRNTPLNATVTKGL
ncbi:MAG TPA: glycoside hydrolase family 3 C-terminal domain-containing protein [Bryobacteraceae bacterium]|nr:glycoside hydrolase family 3 C-terminal domain-containing protein [Bryobacteraceae bacterium]